MVASRQSLPRCRRHGPMHGPSTCAGVPTSNARTCDSRATIVSRRYTPGAVAFAAAARPRPTALRLQCARHACRRVAEALPRAARCVRRLSRCVMTQPPAARSAADVLARQTVTRSESFTGTGNVRACTRRHRWTWRWGRGQHLRLAQKPVSGSAALGGAAKSTAAEHGTRGMIGLSSACSRQRSPACSATTALGQETRQPPGNSSFLDHRGRSVRGG